MSIIPLVYLVVSQAAPGTITDKDLTSDKILAAPAEAAPADAASAAPVAEAAASAEPVPPPPPPSPWKYTLILSVNGAMTRSTNVIGTVDGTSAQLGAIIDGSANYTSGQHSWENVGKLNESFTRTPSVPSFLKSADELRLQSTYVYRFSGVPWLGAYGRLLGTTSIFRGYEVRGVDTVIVRTFADGTSSGPITKVAGNKYGTTSPFEPTVLRESAGAFANPLTRKDVNLKLRLGAAMQHVITQDGFALSDDKATTEVEYRQLVSSTAAGAELGLEAVGSVADNVSYTARADFFYPLYESEDSPQDGIEKLNTDISGKLSVRLSKYFSLDYILSLKRIPIIVDEWQVQNGLLVSCNYSVF